MSRFTLSDIHDATLKHLSALLLLFALDIDLVSSSDDECKLPPHSKGANKYQKHETHNKNRTNDTETGEIYDAASLLNIILCNPREFHSVCKPAGIRENFICTLNKKEIPIASCRADDNGAYLR